MDRNPKLNFREEVLTSLLKEIITKKEAKECLKRGFGNEELPIFSDFKENESIPLKSYILGLEKMGIFNLLFRLDE